MNINLLIISIIAFLLIFWFQFSDKYLVQKPDPKKKIKNIFNKIKIPLLVACLILLATYCGKEKEIPIKGITSVTISPSVPSTNQEIFMGQPDF